MLRALIVATLLLIGGSLGPAFAETFVHRSTPANSSGNFTLLDNPALNGNPNATVVILLCESGPACAGQKLGVWYSTGRQRWSVFLQDPSQILGAGSVFRLRTDNIVVVRGGGAEIVVDDPAFNASQWGWDLIATPNYNPGGVGTFRFLNESTYRYFEGHWRLADATGAPFPADAAFNVALESQDGPAQSGQGPAGGASIVTTMSGRDVLASAPGLLIAPPDPPATAAALAELGARMRAKYPLAPGVYRIRAAHSQLCLEHFFGAGAIFWFPIPGPDVHLQEPFIRQVGCPATGIQFGPRPLYADAALFAVIPHEDDLRRGAYSIRPLGDNQATYANYFSPNSQNRLRYCLTAARGVLIGAPRVDVHPCDADASGDWRLSGAEFDQQFILVRTAPYPATFNGLDGEVAGVFSMVNSNIDRPGCVDIAQSSRNPGVDAIIWDCLSQPNQRFEFIYESRLGGDELRLLMAHGWREGIDGLHRAEIVQGAELPGGDSRSTDTESRSDADCLHACLMNAQCHAMTWYRPGARGPQGMCILKSAINAPVANGDARSAIVRP